MVNKYQHNFLSDNPDFRLLKDEVWCDALTGKSYKTFPRFANFEDRSITEILFMYKEQAREKCLEEDYKNSFWMRIRHSIVKFWVRITNAIARFMNRKIDYQYHVLMRIILTIAIVMIPCEFFNFKYGNLQTNMFVAALCICLVYIPIQMLINLFNSIHIYRFNFDNSPDKIIHNSCICYSYEIRGLKKYKLLYKYIMRNFKESELRDNQLFIKRLVLYLRKESLSFPRAFTYIGCICRFNQGEYNLFNG